MSLTKSVISVTDWTAVAQNAVGESSVFDASGAYSALLHIELALTSATAHTGTKIAIQVSGNTSGDQDWTTLTEFIGPTGTPNTEDITDNPLSAGSSTIAVASTTGLYDDDETRQIYIKDGTIANSELVQLISHVTDTSITILDTTANAHVQTTPLWDIAQSYTIEIPFATNRVRVIIDNTYDSDGASCDFKVRASRVSAI